MADTNKLVKVTVKLIDSYSKQMKPVLDMQKKYDKSAKSIKPVILKAKDMASKIIAKAKSSVDKFKATKSVQVVMKAVDKVTTITKRILSDLRAFSGKVWSTTVSVNDKASGVLGSIKGKMTALAAGVTISVAAKTGFNELASEQTQKITIGRVIENSGKTKEQAKKATDEYYKYLEDYANKTPFETSAVAQFGTKAMMMSGGNVDNAKKITDTMGNVKAFVGDLRTETEVAEAFFSASNGNMDMLNNMLGENYQTMDEAMAGIQKKQGGLVNEMSGTMGGLLSTITGKFKVGLKGVTKVFEDVLGGGMSGVISMIDTVTPKVIEFTEKVLVGLKSFAESEQAAAFLDIFKTVATVAFDMIGNAIETCRPFVENVFNFIASKAPEISNIVEGLGVIWDGVMKVLGTALDIAWKIVEPLLSGLIDMLSDLSTWIKNIGSWWTDMANSISNNPIVAKVTETWDKVTGKGSKKNAFGSGRIARNGETHVLHQGEKVLTKNQANQYEKGVNGGINININGLSVREEADVKKIATQIVRELKLAKMTQIGV